MKVYVVIRTDDHGYVGLGAYTDPRRANERADDAEEDGRPGVAQVEMELDPDRMGQPQPGGESVAELGARLAKIGDAAARIVEDDATLRELTERLRWRAARIARLAEGLPAPGGRDAGIDTTPSRIRDADESFTPASRWGDIYRAAGALADRIGSRATVGGSITGYHDYVEIQVSDRTEADRLSGLRAIAELFGTAPVEHHPGRDADDVYVATSVMVHGIEFRPWALVKEPDLVAEARAWIEASQ